MTEHKGTRGRKISIRLSEQELLMLRNACDINISDFIRDAVKHYMVWLESRRPATKVSGKAKYTPTKDVFHPHYKEPASDNPEKNLG